MGNNIAKKKLVIRLKQEIDRLRKEIESKHHMYYISDSTMAAYDSYIDSRMERVNELNFKISTACERFRHPQKTFVVIDELGCYIYRCKDCGKVLVI